MAGFASRGGLGLGCGTNSEEEEEEVEEEVEETIEVTDHEGDSDIDNNGQDELLSSVKKNIECPEDILSDEYDSETDNKEIKQKRRSNVIKASRMIFNDVSYEFASLNLIKKEFEKWRLYNTNNGKGGPQLINKEFKECYVMQSLPSLLSCYADVELCEWPLLWLGYGSDSDNGSGNEIYSIIQNDENGDDENDNPEKKAESIFYHARNGAIFPITDQSWVGELADFGVDDNEDNHNEDQEDHNEDESSVELVPRMVVKCLIPKIVLLMINGYDVYSFHMTKILVTCCGELLEFGLDINKDLALVLSAPIEVFKQSISTLFIPIADKTTLDEDDEDDDDDAYMFMVHQICYGLKLLRNVCAWAALVDPNTLATLAIKDILIDKIIPALNQVVNLGRATDACRLTDCLLSALPPNMINIGW
eukprot:CAMPEP_0114342372 /NCGR_PEP_ID=MMETSP0101-20121206/9751_1 /TAXON_ID=38822 ORGANISM="Pteridomonas danica, Strain PT" /NCGR_SAMPLE_ID=MMETSP0101 /ASSEMBLY_ACC=CAM_ASM_000211 /LENGTH=419 /DNA_ID=CAMNT_0001476449 /DNA_START=1145 /DNA_END=2401 /DNA_ORIENTATION=+